MASLTPGILSKLLQNIHNKTAKVAGEHRSPHLQVIGVIARRRRRYWQSKGFYLRVSDSVHSLTYRCRRVMWILIMSDKIQLGQFIHVIRIDSGSPVPVLRGVKPVPKMRECLWDPKDLIGSDSLLIWAGNKGRTENFKPKVKLPEMNLRRVSLGNGKIEGSGPRSLSLDLACRG